MLKLWCSFTEWINMHARISCYMAKATQNFKYFDGLIKYWIFDWNIISINKIIDMCQLSYFNLLVRCWLSYMYENKGYLYSCPIFYIFSVLILTY